VSQVVVLKRRLLAVAPAPVVRQIFKRRELNRLRKVPAIAAENVNLRVVSEDSLKKAMLNASISDARDVWFKRIESLNITAFSGGVNLGDRCALFSLVAHMKPKSVLEVGTHIGASTVCISAGLAAAHPTTELSPELTSVDIINVNDRNEKPWLANGSPLSPSEILDELGLGDRARFVASRSLDYLQKTDCRFDLIFLDGDHSAATVYQELPAALRCLNPNGIILLHDYYPGGKPIWRNGATVYGPWMAVERLIREGAALEAVPFPELPWDTKLHSRRSSLAVLSRA